jgi:hypothetical protein
MTTTIETRTVTVDEALTSVVGYLLRSSWRLAADHKGGKQTPASLRGLADGLHIIGGRLLEAADVLQAGGTTLAIRDTIRPAMPEDEALIEGAEEAIAYFRSRES